MQIIDKCCFILYLYDQKEKLLVTQESSRYLKSVKNDRSGKMKTYQIRKR